MAGNPRRKQRRRRRDRDGATPTPDPLHEATPYVDQAKMAEEGVDVPPPGGDQDDLAGDREIAAAPDALERDFAPERTGLDAAGTPTRRKRGRFITFLGHCVDELRRVQWPDRRQVGQGTAVTLGFVVLAGAYLGLMDALWKPLIEAIL
jgi:preprotein translocase SecE subunit